MTASKASRIVPWEPRWERGAIDVVQGVFEEYDLTWEAEGYHRDLSSVKETYLAAGGGFWVMLAGERVVGCIGALDRGEGVVEGERLYLLAEWRGRGEGERLFRHLIEWARERGFSQLIGWSDKRFSEAHGLYAKLGMARVGERICDDPDESAEWGFALRL